MRDLDVDVHDGVAELRGRVPSDVADRVVELAEGTKGVRRVRNHLQSTRGGRRHR